MAKDSNLSFKLETDDAERFEDRALKHGMSRSDLGRKLIHDFLNDDVHDILRHQLAGFREEINNIHDEVQAHKDGIRMLREDFATAMVVLLKQAARTDGQKKDDPLTDDKIVAWVRENLMRPSD